MLALAVDTSSAVVSAALVEVTDATDWRVLARRDQHAPNRHGELLAVLIAQLYAEAACEPAALDAVVAGVGPGPFTGLRVGIVTAAALSDALSVPSYAVCSLDAVAHAHRDEGDLLVATDARRRQVYWARYDSAGHRVKGPDLSPPGELVDRFRDDEVTAVGAGVLLHREAFAPLRVAEESPYAAAVHVAALAVPRVASAAPSERLEPLYLRRPDAVPSTRPKSVLPA